MQHRNVTYPFLKKLILKVPLEASWDIAASIDNSRCKNNTWLDTTEKVANS